MNERLRIAGRLIQSVENGEEFSRISKQWRSANAQPKQENGNVSMTIERTETERKSMLGFFKSKPSILVPQQKARVAPKAAERVVETPHQKVFRLVKERRFSDAARIAKGLIDGANIEGFFIYGGTEWYRRADVLVRERVARAQKDGAFCDVLRVTPEIAQRLLTNNHGNRRIDVTSLADRMRDMVDGCWDLNGQGAIVAKTGELNDGQHRLWSILLTGQQAELPVFFGASRDTRRSLDSGKKRGDADDLGFHGVANATRVAGIVALVGKIMEERALTRRERFERHYHDPELYQTAVKWSAGMPRGAPGASLGAAIFILIKYAGADPNEVERFFTSLRGAGNNHKKNSASAALCSALLMRTFKGKPEHLTYTAINLFLRQMSGKRTAPGFPILTTLDEGIK